MEKNKQLPLFILLLLPLPFRPWPSADSALAAVSAAALAAAALARFLEDDVPCTIVLRMCPRHTVFLLPLPKSVSVRLVCFSLRITVSGVSPLQSTPVHSSFTRVLSLSTACVLLGRLPPSPACWSVCEVEVEVEVEVMYVPL